MDFYNKVVIDKNYAIQFKSGLFYTFYTLLKNPFPRWVKHLSVVSDIFCDFIPRIAFHKHATFMFVFGIVL